MTANRKEGKQLNKLYDWCSQERA